MVNLITEEARAKMEKSLEAYLQELMHIRTGRASLGLLDNLEVEVYGSKMKLNQVATIAAPEARMLTVQPWDKTVIPEIEKAIQASDLGLNPQNDGVMIRLPVPPLTEERRKELVKIVKRMGEEAKVTLRNIRREGNDKIKKLEKQHEISEDNMHTKQEEIQKLTDSYGTSVDKVIAAKEKEIMEI
ncbi:MAG: ribosome recycling factor [Candidatus Krumholzibacteriota bacterium]|nr:ribosome recycling factor [Candidatus Krumholzibacteriota bacterium]